MAARTLIGYIAVEIRILAQPSAPMTTEVVYLATSLAMLALATAILAT